MDTDVHRTSPSLVKPTVPFEEKSLASVPFISKILAVIKIHTSEIRRRIIVPRIVKGARDALIVYDWQVRGILRVRTGLLDAGDVDSHDD